MRLPGIVRQLSPVDVQVVVDDLRLIDSGYRLHLCIDPYEVFDFCFPINPEATHDIDMDDMADDQAALHHTFFNWGNKVWLLPEYRGELDRLMRYFEYVVGHAYSRAALVDALIRGANLTPGALDQKDRLRHLEQDFNVVLAVIMGIYSVGVQRLHEVIRERLDRTSVENSAPMSADDGLRKSIFDSVADALKRQSLDEVALARRLRNAETDAAAIARVIRLNKREGASRRRDRGGDVYLYVSSAPRTRHIFALPEVIGARPMVNGKPLAIWRNRSQMFIHSLYATTYKSYDRSLNPVEYLTKLLPVVAETSRFSHLPQCRFCLLHGGKGERDCRLIKLCDMLLSLDYGIDATRKAMRNLTLVNSVENFNKLRSAKPANDAEREYVEFFSKLFEEKLKDAVIARIRELQHMVFIKWEFSENMPAMYQHGHEMIKSGHVDEVTNPIQALPTYLKVSSVGHRGVIDAVMKFHKEPDVPTANALDDAYSTFVQTDRVESSLRREHEAVRCLLYMACIGVSGGVSGNELALQHAKTMLDELKKKPDQADFVYISAWALRRLGRYAEADRLLMKAVTRFPKDPRMWHGRSINAFSWSQADAATYPYKLLRPIKDAKRAIELYALDGELGNEACAVNWNNLSYMQALVKATPYYNLRAARGAIMELKRILPRDRWYPRYPEFFHTEAFLEYNEYLAGTENPRVVIDRVAKLENAQRMIDRALQIHPKEKYEDLRRKIEAALGRERSLADGGANGEGL